MHDILFTKFHLPYSGFLLGFSLETRDEENRSGHSSNRDPRMDPGAANSKDPHTSAAIVPIKIFPPLLDPEQTQWISFASHEKRQKRNEFLPGGGKYFVAFKGDT